MLFTYSYSPAFIVSKIKTQTATYEEQCAVHKAAPLQGYCHRYISFCGPVLTLTRTFT